jgi:hypothetical protein
MRGMQAGNAGRKSTDISLFIGFSAPLLGTIPNILLNQ